MPLYEYVCDACGHRFEVIQKFSDAPIEACPSCGGAVRKLLSSPAIHFKGTGWYITDYGRKGGTSASGEGTSSKDSSSAASATSAPGSGSETTTATKDSTKDSAAKDSKKDSTKDSKKD
jgi:putative FmdB family regulatory protein